MSSAPSGLDMSDIARLVDRFYERVGVDPEIGPVFNAAVHDWDAHKRLLTSFWSSIALRAGTYRGNPMAAHQALPINAGHFTRWLALWRETCAQELDPEHAAQMIGYAERIGRSLAYGLGIGDGGGRPGLRIVGVSHD
jgi:hemoglobin